MVLLTLGRLAKQTRLPTNVLHQYEAIGLLKPSSRSNAGDGLYDHDDIVRLYRIRSLRRLGLSLAEVATLTTPEAASLPEIIDRHVAALDDQILQAIRLRTQLDSLRDRLMRGDHAHLGDWLITLELMTQYDKYFAQQEVESTDSNKPATTSPAHADQECPLG